MYKKKPHPTATRLREMAYEIDMNAGETVKFLSDLTMENQAKLIEQANNLRCVATQLRVLADTILPHD